MGSSASSEPIMQSSHAYLLSIQLCLIEKRKLFFTLEFFINSRLILCLMIGSFNLRRKRLLFHIFWWKLALTVTGFMKKATLYVVLNNINNSMTLNNAKNKLYSSNAYEIIWVEKMNHADQNSNIKHTIKQDFSRWIIFHFDK